MAEPVVIKKVWCDFCGKMQDYVQHIIAGRGVHICDECVQICVDVIEEQKRAQQAPK